MLFKNPNKVFVIDFEADGLLDTVTKIHVLAWKNVMSGKVGFTHDYEEMRKFLAEPDITLICHSYFKYDRKLAQKILGIEVTDNAVDTLPLSQTLYPNRNSHGLESWGVSVGVPKPLVSDWENLTQAEYRHRCQMDVEINYRAFCMIYEKLKKIYSHGGDAHAYIEYLNFKMQCAADQESIRWKLDVPFTTAKLEELTNLLESKKEELANVMPRVTLFKKRTKPKNMFTKSKALSKLGESWLKDLTKLGLEHDFGGEIKIAYDTTNGNPQSPEQIKNWLFSLGWQPCTFSFTKDSNGVEKSIPQVYADEGKLTPSVHSMLEEHPELEPLAGLSILKHRVGILKGFLKNCSEDGYVQASISSLTNTLRFQHQAPCVNLPTPSKPYGEIIRSCLIARSDSTILCGSDMSSLEDNTKQHYMMYYDPDYVTSMRVPGFDPHLDIALLAGLMTENEVNLFKVLNKTEEKADEQKVTFKRLNGIRKKAKVVNFSGVYGAGATKIAKSSGMSLAEATKLHKIYWTRNWSVKKIGADTRKIKIDGEMWQFNPVSKFWYSLRAEKDAFSTLNQGKHRSPV